MSLFHDHFSGHADAYAAARPHYPPALFDWLAKHCRARTLAVDVGCGNGQASVQLARHFERVEAFDPSAAQLDQARPHPAVRYTVAPAEHLPLDDHCADLLVVAQALHWFDFPRFFNEVRRVLRPGGHFCAVHYPLLRIEPWIDQRIEAFEHHTVGTYWPPERRHIDTAFVEVAFPFRRLQHPDWVMQHDWTLAQLGAYLATWSAVQRYRQARGTDPVPALLAELTPRWGDPQQPRSVRWPLLVWLGVAD